MIPAFRRRVHLVFSRGMVTHRKAFLGQIVFESLGKLSIKQQVEQWSRSALRTVLIFSRISWQSVIFFRKNSSVISL